MSRKVFAVLTAVLCFAAAAFAQGISATLPTDGSTTSNNMQGIVLTFSSSSAVNPATIELWVEGVLYTTASPEVRWIPANLYFNPTTPLAGEVTCSLAVARDWSGEMIPGMPFVTHFTVDQSGPVVVHRGIAGVESDTFPVILGPNTFAEPSDEIVIEWYVMDEYSDLDPITLSVEVEGVVYTYPCPELEWINDGIVLSVDTIVVDTDTTFVPQYADYVAFHLFDWHAMDTIFAEILTFADAPDYGTASALAYAELNAISFFLDYLGPEARAVEPLRTGTDLIRTSCTDQRFVFDVYDENGIDPTTLTFEFRGATHDFTSPLVELEPIWDYAATYWHICVPDTFFEVVWPRSGFYWRSACIIRNFVVDTLVIDGTTIYDTLFFVTPTSNVASWSWYHSMIASGRANTRTASLEASEDLYAMSAYRSFPKKRLALVWDNTIGLDFDAVFNVLGTESYAYMPYDTLGCAFGDDEMAGDELEVMFISYLDPNVHYIYDTVVTTYDRIAPVAKSIYCRFGWGYYDGTFRWPWEEPSVLHPILTTTTDLAQVGTRVTITPNPPIYQGEDLNVRLLTCDDVYGNAVLPNNVNWNITADRTAPYLVGYTPAHNTITADNYMPISVTLADRFGAIDPTTMRIRIEYSGGVINIDNPASPFAPQFEWNAVTGTFTYFPERDGVMWAEGDTVSVIFYDVTDSIEICEPNHYAHEYPLVAWTFFILNGPFVQNVQPANLTVTSCEEQVVSFTIFDEDGINPGSVQFLFEDRIYTIADIDSDIVCTWMHFGPTDSLLDCDTTIYSPLVHLGGGYFEFRAPLGTYYDGRQINCMILNAEDIGGDPLWYVGDYAWTFTVDRTPPIFFDPQPAPGTFASGSDLVVSIAIVDSITHEIDAAHVTLSVNGVIYSTVTTPFCTWDGERFTMNFAEAGVRFADGTLITACLDDVYDGVDYYCDRYPNRAEDTPACWSFHVDNAAPTATALGPQDATVTACATQPIQILLGDNLGVDPASIMLIVEGRIYTIASPELTLIGDTLVFIPTTPWADGQVVDYSLAQVGDIAGNVLYDTPGNTTFLVDLTAPAVLGTMPAEGEVITEAIDEIAFDVFEVNELNFESTRFFVDIVTVDGTEEYDFAYGDEFDAITVEHVFGSQYHVALHIDRTDIFFPSRGASVEARMAIEDMPDYHCFGPLVSGNELVGILSFDVTPGWRVDLTLATTVVTYDSTGAPVPSAETFVITMGAAFGASELFDMGIDELSIPLPPGPVVVPPSFLLDDLRLGVDIKSLSDPDPRWLVWTGTTAGTLWWNPENLPEYGAFVINGVIDMRSTDHYAYGPAEAVFINFTPEFITLYAGWNLVSVPVQPADPYDIGGIFHVDPSQVFWFNPYTDAYENATVVIPGYAYFVLYIPGAGAPVPFSFSVAGSPIYEYSVEMPMGWNTIGSVFDFGGVLVSEATDVFTVPAGALWGTGVYELNPMTGAYQYSSEIFPGKGYWAYLSLPAPYTSARMAVQATWLRGAPYKDPLSAEAEAHLTIDNAELVLAYDDAATNAPDPELDRLMPPSMLNDNVHAYLMCEKMSLMRDVRANGEWTLVLTKAAVVHTDKPIYVAGELVNQSVALSAGTYKVALGSLPKAFALHQNTPNPFNPVTEIAFDLPEETNASLEVYNMIGQKVRTLTDGTLSAGAHKLVWNGTDDNGKELPSGVYFYKLSAGDNSRTMKAILLK